MVDAIHEPSGCVVKTAMTKSQWSWRYFSHSHLCPCD